MNGRARAVPRGARGPSGFSLVELLVAMAVGLVLTVGTVSVFVANQRSGELNDATATMQENARFALEGLVADLRMAGHQGCAALGGGGLNVGAAKAPFPVGGTGLAAAAVSAALVAEDGWRPTLAFAPPPRGFDPEDADRAVPGSHAIALQFGTARTWALAGELATAGVPDPSAPVVTREPVGDGLEAGDLAIVSDCLGADLFEVTSVAPAAGGGSAIGHAAPANASGSLSIAYGSAPTLLQTRLMRFAAHVYYVGDTGLVNDAGDPITALYQQSWPFDDPDNPPTELVQGVERLRVALGVDDGSGSISYVDPGTTAYAPEDVRSVRLGLLLSSWKRLAGDGDAPTFLLAGTPVGPAADPAAAAPAYPDDGRFRMAFNTTVKVRNFR